MAGRESGKSAEEHQPLHTHTVRATEDTSRQGPEAEQPHLHSVTPRNTC